MGIGLGNFIYKMMIKPVGMRISTKKEYPKKGDHTTPLRNMLDY